MTRFAYLQAGAPTTPGATFFVPNGMATYWGQYPYYRVYRVDYQIMYEGINGHDTHGTYLFGTQAVVGLDPASPSDWSTYAESPGFKYIRVGEDVTHNSSYGRTIKGSVYLPRVKAQSSTQFKGDETNRVHHGIGQSIGNIPASEVDNDNQVYLEYYSYIPSPGPTGYAEGPVQYTFTFYVEWFGQWPDRTRTSTTVSL